MPGDVRWYQPNVPRVSRPYGSGTGPFEAHLRILDALFPPGWFETDAARHHPARRRWELCRTALRDGGAFLKLHEQDDDLPEVARIGLDTMVLIDAFGGSHDALRLGDPLALGGPAKWNMIRSRLTKPNQFDDVLFEIAMAAWHKMYGHRVEPLEKPNGPDLTAYVPGWDRPLAVECKRVRVDSPAPIRKHLVKANQQIRGVGD